MNQQPQAEAATKTVYGISIDPDPLDGGVGGSEWRADQAAAEQLFQQMCLDPAHNGTTLTLFSIPVPASAQPGQVSQAVNDAAWEHDYEEIRRHIVTVTEG